MNQCSANADIGELCRHYAQQVIRAVLLLWIDRDPHIMDSAIRDCLDILLGEVLPVKCQNCKALEVSVSWLVSRCFPLRFDIL